MELSLNIDMLAVSYSSTLLQGLKLSWKTAVLSDIVRLELLSRLLHLSLSILDWMLIKLLNTVVVC